MIVDWLWYLFTDQQTMVQRNIILQLLFAVIEWTSAWISLELEELLKHSCLEKLLRCVDSVFI